jgi:glutathione synthase/RimK-type ligase-like ATP-grasp enzyme
MLIGIHNTWPNKPDLISDVYRKILNHNEIEYIDLNCNSPDFWEKIKTVDAFIFRWANTDYHSQLSLSLIPIIENVYQIPCFPNMSTCWHYDDKVRQSLLLESHNLPVCKSYVFWERKEALKWFNSTELPLVFKLKTGSGSMQVKLITRRRQGIGYINRMFKSGFSPDNFGIYNSIKTFNFDISKILRYWAVYVRNRYLSPGIAPFWNKQKNYVYFQKYLPGNLYDTRVQITGERAYAFRRYNRPNDFRASGSNNWSIDHRDIDMNFVKIAFEISEKLNFQSMAYDFIYDDLKKPAIIEISYCFGDYPEFSTGYWDKDLNWIPGHFLPQYFELVDLLKMPDLKLPGDLKSVSSYSSVKIQNE